MTSRAGSLLLACCIAAGTLATSAQAAELRVDTLVDGPDAHVGDGQCRTADGACTLRAAVQEANAGAGADTIVLPAGRLLLTRPNVWPLPQQTADTELDAADGDLDILGDVTVRGAGADRTTIDAGAKDRAFAVSVGVTAAFRDLTITHGDPTVNNKTDADISLGGAILNNGDASLERVALVGNRADGGGGLFSIPLSTIVVRDSLIADNVAVEGGGLRLDSGGTVVNTTITHNRLEPRPFGKVIPDEITGYGGGIDHRGGDNVTIVNSTITDNHAYKAGGGVNSGQDYAPVVPAQLWPFRVTLLNTIVAGNTADAGPGDCHVANMRIVSRGHNLDGDGTCFLGAAGDLPKRDPQLGPLSGNGGPTATRALLATSPAVDAGSEDGCPGADQRGVPRIRCDIGAYEFVATACSSRRVVLVRLPRGLRSVRVTYAGRTARLVRRHGRRYARIDLRGVSAGRVVVRVRGRDAHGAAVRRTRVLRTCSG